ncbi:MAG: hypothetical protein RQ891_05485 [Thermoflexus sp.]|jgi:uncharacterized membrane protein|uniref:Uncharacterized protein n=1 Tax=Thermoflexus hugenholtzii JAD2 TaxID=877466 RepID=A0A212QQI1_9CHLR|nr:MULTISPECIES: hypothetical protein [Thermoflexus]MDT7884289.1 hypothetical protein [Thermoflexus sp.]MDT7947935.1 hypothetical protein [Thermoflexus sp.]QWK09376.1 MAG: hypothetical protein KNN16_08325 [Thermoflexus hugenholtzii]SNB61758.1 hypothetical protein SAMN02746019_00003910 [Thermoflexus hugenholtzii JAD2]
MSKRGVGVLMLLGALALAGSQVLIQAMRMGRSPEWGPLQQAALAVAVILAVLALPLLVWDGRPA